MKKNKIIIGTLIGAVAGMVAGILTAPRAGKETRADVAARAAELKAEAVRRANASKQKTTEAPK